MTYNPPGAYAKRQIVGKLIEQGVVHLDEPAIIRAFSGCVGKVKLTTLALQLWRAGQLRDEDLREGKMKLEFLMRAWDERLGGDGPAPDGLFLFLHGTNEERNQYGAITREATPTIMVWHVVNGELKVNDWFEYSVEGLAKAEARANQLAAELHTPVVA